MVKYICGVDEAGRGPVLGPMVVAAVKIGEPDRVKLDELNLRDSKMCTPKRRDRLAIELKKVCDIKLEILSASKIDELRIEKTLNVIEAELFAKVISSLKPVDKVFVDAADTNEVTFQENVLANLDFEPELISKHKADSIYTIVSAASIIAKTTRDAEIDKIKAEIGEDIGSGYPADEITRKFLTNWIKKHKSLPPHTRSSWKTVKRIIRDNQFKITTLNEYCEESK
jgi:ribonuclease HII